MRPVSRWADRLLVLNVLLQLFDGLATYYGFAVWGEGNPVLRGAIAQVGLGLTLLLAKGSGCALLVFIRFSPAGRLVVPCMATCAFALCALSLVPWLDCFWAEWTV
jgi:hypothetical protein